jgi:hypothetical protein
MLNGVRYIVHFHIDKPSVVGKSSRVQHKPSVTGCHFPVIFQPCKQQLARLFHAIQRVIFAFLFSYLVVPMFSLKLKIYAFFIQKSIDRKRSIIILTSPPCRKPFIYGQCDQIYQIVTIAISG